MGVVARPGRLRRSASSSAWASRRRRELAVAAGEREAARTAATVRMKPLPARHRAASSFGPVRCPCQGRPAAADDRPRMLAETFLKLVEKATTDLDVETPGGRARASPQGTRTWTTRGRASASSRGRPAGRPLVGGVASLPPGWFAARDGRARAGGAPRPAEPAHRVPPRPLRRSDGARRSAPLEVLAGLAAGRGHQRRERRLTTRAAEEIAARLLARFVGREVSHLVPVLGAAGGRRPQLRGRARGRPGGPRARRAPLRPPGDSRETGTHPRRGGRVRDRRVVKFRLHRPRDESHAGGRGATMHSGGDRCASGSTGLSGDGERRLERVPGREPPRSRARVSSGLVAGAAPEEPRAHEASPRLIRGARTRSARRARGRSATRSWAARASCASSWTGARARFPPTSSCAATRSGWSRRARSTARSRTSWRATRRFFGRLEENFFGRDVKIGEGRPSRPRLGVDPVRPRAPSSRWTSRTAAT